MKTGELTIDGLKSFIDKATKLGKYPSNTAGGYLSAVKTVERALLEDEPKTIEYLLEHVEELFVRQDNLKLSPQSLPVYINRIRTVCSDYSKYGVDGTAIYKWNRATRTRTTKIKEEPIKTKEPENRPEEFKSEIFSNSNGQKLNVLSWRLRPGLMMKIELPEDLNEQDVDKIKALLDIELKFGH